MMLLWAYSLIYKDMLSVENKNTKQKYFHRFFLGSAIPTVCFSPNRSERWRPSKSFTSFFGDVLSSLGWHYGGDLSSLSLLSLSFGLGNSCLFTSRWKIFGRWHSGGCGPINQHQFFLEWEPRGYDADNSWQFTTFTGCRFPRWNATGHLTHIKHKRIMVGNIPRR